MLEILFFFVVLFFIGVLFYKQANEEIEILQIEGERLEEVSTLYVDRSPIVLRNFPVPNLGTYEDFRKRPKILQMKMGSTSFSLDQLLHSKELKDYIFQQKTSEYLSKESGLDIWFQHHCFHTLLPSKYTSWFYNFTTSLWPSHRGMWKTHAVHTLLMPTQGTANVSLLLPKMIPYLPVNWKGRSLKSLTMEDTPLLGHIQYVEIKLRKGNALLLPAHILVDVSSEESDVNTTMWMFQSEIHHPISRLSKS